MRDTQSRRGTIVTWSIKTSIGDLTLRQAEESDKSLIIHIKQDAASWLESKGIHQWAGILMAPGEDMVYKRVHEGEVYLALKGAQAVGTISILWEDPISWGEQGLDGKAGYMHGIAILRQYAGKGVGRDIIRWASDLIHGKDKVVRLDCMAENPRINEYYRQLQFQHKGFQVLSTGFKVNLYEKS